MGRTAAVTAEAVLLVTFGPATRAYLRHLLRLMVCLLPFIQAALDDGRLGITPRTRTRTLVTAAMYSAPRPETTAPK